MLATVDPVPQTGWVASLVHLVRGRIGYEIPPHRLVREILPFVVAEAEERGFADPADLVDRLAQDALPALWDDLVARVTIGETRFFRHPEQIAAIAAWSRRSFQRLGRPLQVWSAGCASGEEAWTLALGLEEAGVPARITASDVNGRGLARAEAGGPYSDRSVAHVPAALCEAWLVEVGRRAWHVARREALPVRFVQHNLVTEPLLRPPGGGWDLILCRNVTIYFPPETARRVAVALGASLAEGGRLWLAPCDVVDLAHTGLAADPDAPPRCLLRGAAAVPRAGVPPRTPPVRPTPTRAPPASDWEADLARYRDRGLWASAGGAVDRRLEAAPGDGAARVARAALHLRAHEFEDALRALDRAGAAHPRPEGLEYVRGVTLLKMGRREAALGAFLKAVKDDPDDWASAWYGGEIYRRLGRTLLEEMLLMRTAELLDRERPASPSFGPAGRLFDGVHADPEAIRRLTRERLDARQGRDLPGEASR